MKVKSNGITIELEEEEISTFWNVIAFALDYDTREKCMTESERKMAQKLYNKTEGQ